ncbi:rod shape-determining protein MreC [Persicirhabdus sediminis]|uniref:Cell shape-determining protein MreC n=1 Tax=Persicirhabdus sediminis TaxID=454144 RepID=A0A8J7MGZ6_9BACT|nr:rod shape-determining protein MreC [Persicirhabdus sediminis]MBK1791659.1 rod shape-determining protein MreC [Persicirhabdus sediminis]
MKPHNLIALLLFLAGAIWAITRSEHSVQRIQASYYELAGPLLTQSSAASAKARNFLDEVKHSEETNVQLQLANDELAKLRVEIAHLRKLEEQNVDLHRALDFQENSPFHVMAANIIRRNPATWWQEAVIDRGSLNGLTKQQAVLDAAGLIGKVNRLSEDTSTIILLTDESCHVSAKVDGTPEAGILSGQRGQSRERTALRLRYLSKNAAIEPGMKVYTTGRGGLFPADILLGTVESFESGEVDAEALVRPAVDFTNLKTVFVLTQDG